MKVRIFLLRVFVLLLCTNTFSVNAQNRGGCDLCGPASGSTKNAANGNYSATIGVSCEANGSFSFAVGNAAKSNASMTAAIGKYVRANATNSIVIGSGISNTDTRALINNKANSFMVGFNSTYPTLYVSPSSGYNTTGKVSIGNMVNPKSKLHIKSDTNEDAGIILETSTSANYSYLQFVDVNHRISYKAGQGLQLLSGNDNIVIEGNAVSMNAKVGINVTNNFTEEHDCAFAVSGGILADKVLIKEVSEWYDVVFEDDYPLLSLSELEKYIAENKHLPDLPSADAVKDDGYNIVDMDGTLLKKIEELTLYTIKLSKMLEDQQRVIESLQCGK